MKTILYVEDNPHNALLLVDLLCKYPHMVLIAASATQGLETLKNQKVDLIFLDINLPDIDGLTLVKQLKANEHYRHIPTVALTANAMIGDKKICLEAGFDDYIAKPIMRAELYHLVEQLLAKNDDITSDDSDED